MRERERTEEREREREQRVAVPHRRAGRMSAALCRPVEWRECQKGFLEHLFFDPFQEELCSLHVENQVRRKWHIYEPITGGTKQKTLKSFSPHCLKRDKVIGKLLKTIIITQTVCSHWYAFGWMINLHNLIQVGCRGRWLAAATPEGSNRREKKKSQHLTTCCLTPPKYSISISPLLHSRHLKSRLWQQINVLVSMRFKEQTRNNNNKQKHLQTFFYYPFSPQRRHIEALPSFKHLPRKSLRCWGQRASIVKQRFMTKIKTRQKNWEKRLQTQLPSLWHAALLRHEESVNVDEWHQSLLREQTQSRQSLCVLLKTKQSD